MAIIPAIQAFEEGANAPAGRAIAVAFTATWHDLPFISRAIYVGVAGHVGVVMASETSDSTVVTFSNVPAGTVLPVRARRVKEVSGTATSMVAIA